MAEIVLSSIAEGIIGALRSAAVQEIALLWGVNHELSDLEDTISTIKAVLVDAEEKQIHNHQIRTWLERLEDVVCEADDLVDEFNTEAALQQQRMVFGSEMTYVVCNFFSASNQIASRHRLGHRIKAVKERLRKIRDDRGFHLDVRHEETNRVVIWGREATHSYVLEQEVIGRDRDKMAIIECLLDAINEGNDVSVFPIIGNGGIGKTTLAQLVFNDEKVKKHFDLRLWVCVSNDFNVRLLVEKIIKSATDKGLENLDMDQLQKMLRKEINGKRYLLVLDDVWNEDRELWLKLRILLSNCVNGSRIVVTSRSKVVGEIMSTEEPYILGRLDKDKSWALFKKVAFKYGEEPSNCKIVEIGKEIVEKCGGIPLAIRTIGRMVYYKDPETQWSSFLEMEFSRISQNANDILPTLKLSYDNLPSHLKHCFTFCKIFPKGHEIKVDMLIDLWMALGFVKSSVSTKLLMDMGNEYFTDLLCRSFFQDLQDDGKIKKCKMHDLMHDLATQVGGAGFAFLQQNKKSDFNKNTRHVSFNFHIDSSQQIPTALSQENKIRTLLLLGQSSSVIPARRDHLLCDAVVSSFKLVRILNLNNSGIKIVPNCISKLKHVRYLDLSLNEDIKRLPDSITKLYNLQTLRLSYCKKLQELPRDIKKLVNLVNLHLHGCSGLTHMPCGLDQLTNLQTLSQFVLKNGISSMPKNGGEVGELSDLMGLNNLRRHFGISNLGNGEDTKTANLKEKQHLHSLVLSWQADPLYLKLDDLDYWSAKFDDFNCWSAKFDDAPFYLKEVDYEGTLEGLQPHPNLKFLTLLYYEGVRFSSWLPSLTNLEYFCVENSRKCHYLPPLNQFLSLKVLELRKVLSLEYLSNDSSMSSLTILPSLETLRFERLPNLKGWWREEEVVDDEEDNNSFIGISSRFINQSSPSFPHLSKLVIYGCPKLTFLPLSPNIKSLTVENNNWKLLQHVMRRPLIQKMTAEASLSSLSSSSSSSSSTPFSNLTALVLWNIEDLHSLPEWLKNLTSLQSLGIMYCYNLKCLSPGIRHLASSLQVLSIKGCKELDMFDADEFTWLALKGLRSLNLKKLPQLNIFPEGLQHVTSLQLLKVEGCENLIGIPEWISSLKSLQMLKIVDCPKLTSLPHGVHQLTSLQKLVIEDCPILSKRCQTKIGEDWPKVAHIPQLILKSTSGCNGKVFKNCWMPQLCNKRRS